MYQHLEEIVSTWLVGVLYRGNQPLTQERILVVIQLPP